MLCQPDAPAIQLPSGSHQLWNAHLITNGEYESSLRDLLDNNGKTVRLPKAELESRIRMIGKG